MMKAAVVESPNRLVVKNVPEPTVGEYDALCELLYGATCSGTDSHILAGIFPFASPFPTVLGHESVGRVVKTGAKVRNLRIGDLVTRVGTPPPPGAGISVTWGGFAEFGIASDHWAMCAAGMPPSEWSGNRVNQIVPAGVDPRVAPMFTTWRETRSYLDRMGVGSGSRMLVLGSGGNGLSFAAHAVLRGAACVVMAGAARVEAAARAVGVTGYVDYRTADIVGALKAVNPQGFNVIIDAVGKRGMADAVLPTLVQDGILGIYGIDDYPGVTVTPTRAQGTFQLWSGGYDEAETHQDISELVLRGRLKADPWYDVGHPFDLAAINDAFTAIRERRCVKALIRLHD